MIDIWGYGSNGSLINMVYNTYYGTGYNNTTLTKSRFEMNSYSTQVAQLPFEYIYELDKKSAIVLLSNKCSNNYPWIVCVLHLVIGLGKRALSYSINSFVNWMIPCKAKVD